MKIVACYRRSDMAETKPPLGLDPNLGTREFVIEVDAEALEKRKNAHVWVLAVLMER